MKRLLLTLTLGLAMCTPATAMLVRLPLETITKQSPHVLQGTVVETRSAWTEDRKTIVTDVTLRVDEPLKGSFAKSSTLTVRVQGGIVGDVGLRVEHQPRFYEDEKVLVFLEPVDGGLRVFGDEQGKFSVVEQYVVNQLTLPTPIDSFKSEIRSYIPREDPR